MRASEVIREARTVLFERGWYQGGLRGPGGSLCAMGAISRVASDSDAVVRARSFRALQEAVGGAIPIWNDAPERTFSEVIDAFDNAEKLALIAEESD